VSIKSPSAQQQEIFDWFAKGQGNLVIRARAGCGKTTTILQAIQYAPEQKILLAAFNKEIASELKSRLSDQRARAQTLHSLGYWFCRKNWAQLQIDEKRGMKLAQKAIPVKVDKLVIQAVADLASKAKNVAPFASVSDLVDIALRFGIVGVECATEDESWSIKDLANSAHVAMALACQHDGTIDYDDMIFLPVKNRWVFPLYQLVVIDEAQDMNPAQLMLAKQSCRHNGRVVVVGDNCQAIYAFRGADSDALDNLKQELRAKELGLNITYRCPKKVVALAARLVSDFQAAPTAPEGIVDEGELQFIHQDAAPGDFVLSRTNAPLITVCLAILRQGRPAYIRGRDIGASLCALVRRMQVDTTQELLARIEDWRTDTLQKLKDEGANESAFQAVSDQASTIIVLSEGLVTTHEVLTRIQDLFSNDGKKEAVICSTIHRAKGLESNRVFLLAKTLYCGLQNDGSSSESVEDVRLQEEINIHYVGLTRSKFHLTMVR